MKDLAGSVKSDETLLAILGVLRERDTVTVSEIASSLEIAKSTVHDHLATLERHDFVHRDDAGYALALRFLDYGVAARSRHPIYDVAREKVEELAESTQESVWCVVEEHGEAVYLDYTSGRHSIQTHERVGQRRPIHSIAAGKAILAHLPTDRVSEIVEYHGLEAETDETITDVDDLCRELATIREQGYALNLEETIEGVHAIGVPVLGTDGRVYGSISVGGPANRLTEQRLRGELADHVLGETNEIEINLRQRVERPR